MFYIICGNDNYRCHKALDDIKAGLGSPDMVSINTTALDGKRLTFKEISEICDVVPFMAPKRLVIVEGLLKRFQAGDKQSRGNGNSDISEQPLKDWQGFAAYIKNLPGSTELVLFDPGLDNCSQNPLYKLLAPAAGKPLVLDEIKGRELSAWIKQYAENHGARVSPGAIALLADYIGGDLWALAGEMDKLMLFCEGREIDESGVREMTSFAREDSIFVLVDSVLDGRIKEAQTILHRMLIYGTAPQQILAMIERQLAIILRAKDLSGSLPQAEIKERLGLSPRYPLEKTLKQARSFSLPRLRRAFRCLLDTDVAIKTGKYDNDLALDLMVIELCK